MLFQTLEGEHRDCAHPHSRGGGGVKFCWWCSRAEQRGFDARRRTEKRCHKDCCSLPIPTCLLACLPFASGRLSHIARKILWQKNLNCLLSVHLTVNVTISDVHCTVWKVHPRRYQKSRELNDYAQGKRWKGREKADRDICSTFSPPLCWDFWESLSASSCKYSLCTPGWSVQLTQPSLCNALFISHGIHEKKMMKSRIIRPSQFHRENFRS